MKIEPWLIPLIILICSALISWGVTKATIKYNESRVKEMGQKIDAITKKLSSLVCRPECDSLREKCQYSFGKIETKIDQNRDTVTNQFNDIMMFVGQVKEYMRTHNGIKE